VVSPAAPGRPGLVPKCRLHANTSVNALERTEYTVGVPTHTPCLPCFLPDCWHKAYITTDRYAPNGVLGLGSKANSVLTFVGVRELHKIAVNWDFHEELDAALPMHTNQFVLFKDVKGASVVKIGAWFARSPNVEEPLQSADDFRSTEARLILLQVSTQMPGRVHSVMLRRQ